MRLLILNWRDLEHPQAGGSEVYAQNLARVWASTGHEVVFFCSAFPGLPPDDSRDGYQIVRRGSRLSVYREAPSYYRSQPKGTFDAVLEVINTRPFMAPRWALESRVVALVHQVAREIWRYETAWPIAVAGRYILEPRWLRLYRHRVVLTVSESSRSSLIDYGLSDVYIVHEGLEPPLSRPLPARATHPTVIYVGRLSRNKRPDHAVMAHALMRKALPDAQLWIVGDGPMLATLKKTVGPGVTFFGRVDEPTKQDLMASAHALVATSVREGWGLAVSEAARLGTRTVGYDIPGLRDSVPAAHGVLTPPQPEALAKQLILRVPGWMAKPRADLGDVGVVRWDKVAEEVMAHLMGDQIESPSSRAS